MLVLRDTQSLRSRSHVMHVDRLPVDHGSARNRSRFIGASSRTGFGIVPYEAADVDSLPSTRSNLSIIRIAQPRRTFGNYIQDWLNVRR